MKTRIVKVSRGYVPQVQNKKVCLFFNKLVWTGISPNNSILHEAVGDQLIYCVVKTEKEAVEIIDQYKNKKDDSTLLF
jgi:hypothetical protein